MTIEPRTFGIRIPMKAFLTCLMLSTANLLAQSPAPAPASVSSPASAHELKRLLQDGLFEEEANRNLEKAAAAYESLLSAFEQQRQYAATALFRLAEVRAKQNRKEDAIALYQRVVAEFGKDPLAKLSRERLSSLGTSAPVEGAPAIADKEAEEIKRLEDLVKNSPDLLNAPDQGVTPLGKAAGEGWLNAAKFLLDRGADIGGRFGTPALHLAALNGRKAMVELLLARGADVNGKDLSADTALVAAITSSRPEVAKVLIEHGADPLARNQNDHTPLHYACGKGDVEMVRMLLPKSSDLNVVSRNQISGSPFGDEVAGTPLMLATRNNQPAIMKLLLDRGADPNVEAPAGKSALRIAVQAENRELVTLLLEHRANPNIPGLLAATITGDMPEIARLLIKHGADVNLKDPQSPATPLHVAVGMSLELTKMLLDAGASPDGKNSYGETPLHTTLGYFTNPNGPRAGGVRGRTRVINSTIPRPGGQPLPPIVPMPRNPSLPAKEVPPYDPIPILKLLVEKGANVNAHGTRGRTVLSFAISNENVPLEVLEWLIAHGADPRLANAPDPTQPDQPVISVAEAAATMERRIWLEQRVAFPEWTKAQQISAVIRLAGIASNREPVVLKPAAEFDSPPSPVEVIRALAQSLQAGSMIPIDFKLRVFRKTEGDKVQEVVNVPLTASRTIEGKLPELQWGDVVVLFREQTGGGLNQAQDFTRISSNSPFPPRKISVQLGERKSEVQLSGYTLSVYSSPLWSPTGGSLPGWNISELVTYLASAEPRANVAAIKVQRKQPDGQLKEWTVDLRSDSPGRPIKHVPARLADGDALIVPLLPLNAPAAIAQRMKGIYRVSPGRIFGERVFEFTESDDAPRSLGELITEAYKTSEMVVPDPDFSRILIHRLNGANGTEETLTVDLAARIEQVSGKTSEDDARKLDYPLQPGDVVEIPMIEKEPAEKWEGFPGQVQLFFGKALARTVTVVAANGEEKKVGLSPAFRAFRTMRNQDRLQWDAGLPKQSFRAWPLVSTEKNLLKVRIQSRGKTREFAPDALKTASPWLIDGDRIEIERF